MTAPQIQHSKGPCVSSVNKRPTLQTLFFTHDIITSSNYAYLSLQTHQLSAISAVIGNRFTIVKLHTLCTCHQLTSLQAREAVLFQMKSSSIYAFYLFLKIITASKNRTLEWLSVFTYILSTACSIAGTRQCKCTFLNSNSCWQSLPFCVRFSMSVRPKWLQQHNGITHDVLARKCNPFYLENLFNYSMRIRKSVCLCLGKSPKFWVRLHYPHPPYFMSCGGKKSAGFMHLSTVEANQKSREK